MFLLEAGESKVYMVDITETFQNKTGNSEVIRQDLKITLFVCASLVCANLICLQLCACVSDCSLQDRVDRIIFIFGLYSYSLGQERLEGVKSELWAKW